MNKKRIIKRIKNRNFKNNAVCKYELLYRKYIHIDRIIKIVKNENDKCVKNLKRITQVILEALNEHHRQTYY
jgi:CRISPR/Cas system endoribonuclease Cas6 (RAMP superfamily)